MQKEDGLNYHITGTDFWEKVDIKGIDKYNHVFSQSVVSENNEVYKGEYLAYLVFDAAKRGENESLDKLHSMSEGQLIKVVQKFMEPSIIRVAL